MPCAILGGNRAAALIYVKQGAGLGRLSDSQHNADPLGESYKFRQGPNLHFLHHPMFVLGSFPTVWPDHGDFRTTPVNGHSQDRPACLKVPITKVVVTRKSASLY
jgi:hypothetical protein